MTSIISRFNTADRLAHLYREGVLCALLLTEALAAEGFYSISTEEARLCAVDPSGVRWEEPRR